MNEELSDERPNDVILLVDDHTDSRKALAHLFREEGMTVLEAESGEEALEIVDWHNGEIGCNSARCSGTAGLVITTDLLFHTIIEHRRASRPTGN